MLRERLYNLICTTLQGDYVRYDDTNRLTSVFSEQLGLSQEFASKLLNQYFRGRYISGETARNLANLIYENLVQMNLDSQLDEYARALKKRRIDSLAREIDSELCRTIRGGYVSYTRADRAAQSFSRTIKIPYEFAYRMMLDYARGKYCSYDAASYYSQMMAERIISKYENYPDLQERTVPRVEQAEEERAPTRNEVNPKIEEENQNSDSDIPEKEEKPKEETKEKPKREIKEKPMEDAEEKQPEVKETNEQVNPDECAENKDLSESTSSTEEKKTVQKTIEETQHYCECAVQTDLTDEIIEKLLKTQNRFFLE